MLIKRQNIQDKLIYEAKQKGITNDNFIACTLIIPIEQANDLQQTKELFKQLNISAVGVAEFELIKANGWHIHFVAKKEKRDYLLKKGIHITKDYDLNGWLWYMTKQTSTLTTIYSNEQFAVNTSKQLELINQMTKKEFLFYVISSL